MFICFFNIFFVFWSPIQADYFKVGGPTWAPLDPGPGVNSPGVHQGPVSGPANIYIQIVFFLLVVLFLSKNKLGFAFQNMLIFILNYLMRKVRQKCENRAKTCMSTKKADGAFCFRQQAVNEDSRKGKQVRQRKHEVANIYQLFASPKVAVHETYPPSSWLFRKHADTQPVGNNSIYVWSNEKRKVFLNLLKSEGEEHHCPFWWKTAGECNSLDGLAKRNAHQNLPRPQSSDPCFLFQTNWWKCSKYTFSFSRVFSLL